MPSPTKSPRPPGEVRLLSQSAAHRRRQIQRRRATALGGLAVLVLLISIVVGDVSGGSGHHGRPEAPIIGLEPRGPAVLNRKAVARHPRMAGLPEPAQRDQLDSQAEWMHRLGVPQPRMFRPPYGSFNNTTFSLLKKRRMLMVLWSVDSQDFRQPGTATIVRRVLSAAKPGAIVLMHDAGGLRAQTGAALPIIIQKLRKRHFRLVTVPEL